MNILKLSTCCQACKNLTFSTKWCLIKDEIEEEVKKMAAFDLQLKVGDLNNKTRTFQVEKPRAVSREVVFYPETKSANGFYLPRIESTTFRYKDQFIGDVQKGGTCNMDILRYIPHGLTHIETSAHILARDERAVTLKDIPPQNLCGLVYLMDLTRLEAKPGQSIYRQNIEGKIKKITLPITMLTVKTKASLLPQDTDFSGKDFLHLHPDFRNGLLDVVEIAAGIDHRSNQGRRVPQQRAILLKGRDGQNRGLQACFCGVGLGCVRHFKSIPFALLPPHAQIAELACQSQTGMIGTARDLYGARHDCTTLQGVAGPDGWCLCFDGRHR